MIIQPVITPRISAPPIYTFSVDLDVADPAARVTYHDDAAGRKPAKMDFAKGTFDYGDWGDVFFVKKNYPVMLKADCTEDYRVDPNDYTKKATDGSASDVASAEYNGNLMAAIPLCWVARWQEGRRTWFSVSEGRPDERFHAYAHTRADGSIANMAYMSCFKGSMVSSKLRSISGQYPQNKTTADAELKAAQANGAGWTLRTWSLQSLLADLCTLISKTCDSQAAFGNGTTTGGGDTEENHFGFGQCGGLQKSGQFWGSTETTKQVKVFHVEDFWGCRWDRLVGLVYQNGIFKAKMTPEGAGYNLTGAGYTPVGTGITGQTQAYSQGWQKEVEQTEYGRLPIAPLTGADKTYETDYFWWNNTITAVCLAGGAAGYGAYCGARCLPAADTASRANWNIGGSLSCISPS